MSATANERLANMKARMEADQKRLEELEAATLRLPLAEAELVAMQPEEDKALAAYHAVVKSKKTLEAEVSACKQLLGIRVRPEGKVKGKGKATPTVPVPPVAPVPDPEG
jgi:DNA repair ATPase RecN